MRRILRFSLVLTALLVLLGAMWAGLIRIGWALPPLDLSLPMLHGPLMINGFLGLVIGLERAVSLSARSMQQRVYWPFLSPICIAAGSLILLISAQIGALLIAVGSLVMVGAFGLIIHRHKALFTLTMGVGAVSWLIGNLLWLMGQPIYTLILWWMGFPLFTIIGERLEISRVLRLSKTSHWLFGTGCLIFLAGAVISLLNLDLAMRIAGVGEIGCALWLLRYDIARFTLHKSGMPRFIALCLISGYGWLAVSGLLNTWFGATYAGPYYDATLHSLFVGFVFSMIFGHAPIILPAVLELPITFNATLYGSLVLLHLSLGLRIVGDLLLMPTERQWGGMLNEIAVLLFLGNVVGIVVHARQSRKIAGVALP